MSNRGSHWFLAYLSSISRWSMRSFAAFSSGLRLKAVATASFNVTLGEGLVVTRVGRGDKGKTGGRGQVGAKYGIDQVVMRVLVPVHSHDEVIVARGHSGFGLYDVYLRYYSDVVLRPALAK